MGFLGLLNYEIFNIFLSFLLQRLKYFLQHPILEHSQTIFFSDFKKPG